MKTTRKVCGARAACKGGATKKSAVKAACKGSTCKTKKCK